MNGKGDDCLDTFMTIQEFSERTGVSKSALRYYESINLLHPIKRNVSGYRIYSEEQVATVKLITSLRLAEVPIKDIQFYLKEDEEAVRQQMKEDWIRMIKERRNLLNVSLRYLESDSVRNQIYLIEKSEESIIWFSAESETGKFRSHFVEKAKELKKFNVPIKNCYLKYLYGKDLIQVQIGFGIPAGLKTNELPKLGLIEQMTPCIYIAMPFTEPIIRIKSGYQKLINYAAVHNWVPTGPILEWYRGDCFTNLDLLMPVTQIEKWRDY